MSAFIPIYPLAAPSGGSSTLAELTDVEFTSLANAEMLAFNATSGKWENIPAPTGTGSVTNVSGTAPIQVATGTTTPVISIDAATTSTAGSMSAADKTKLDGIAPGATNYTHPANHAPSIITQDSSNRFVTDAEIAAWDAKQEELVSGTNIKTINSTSILGSGNIVITGEGGSGVWGAITGTLADQTDLVSALAGKQAAGTYATGSGSASGTNTGDNATNTQYSGLVTNATHTGDVTGSGVLTIAGGAVTLAKMADMATASLLYRKTAGTGVPEIQALATLKTDLGSMPASDVYTWAKAATKPSYTYTEVGADVAGAAAAITPTSLGLVIGTNVQAYDANIVTKTTTDTLTNKRITLRVGSTTSSATPTINTDNIDIYKLTAQAEDITSFTTNLTGTPVDGDAIIIEITGTAARAITWGAKFEASTVALPTTTITTTMLAVAFLWNTATSKWRCVAAV